MEDIKSRIESLYEFALYNPTNEQRIIDIFQIEEALAVQIQESTGLELRGFFVSIDNYGIVHTLLRHGNPAKEAKHGQIAVTKADFVALVEVISAPDTIQLEAKTYGKGVIKETLIFKKEFEHYYIVVKEIRRVFKKGKINRLILQSMYIRKKT